MSAMGIMYNNALVSDFGLYNGIAQSATSLGRCLFPVIAGSLFALGVSSPASVAFPFGVYLPFNVAGALAATAVCISFRLPARAGCRQKEEEREAQAGTSTGRAADTRGSVEPADRPTHR
eukprot:3771074-Prymnesium_polylepis.1